MDIDGKIEVLAKQYNDNEDDLKKIKEALKSREDLKLEITGALKALNSIKEETPEVEEPKKKKAKA